MDDALIAALADYARMRDMLYDALGKDPDRAPPAVISPSSVPPVSAAFNDSAAPPASSASDPHAAPEAPATPRRGTKSGSRFTRRPHP